MFGRSLAVAAAAALLAAVPVQANPIEVLGLTSRHAGQANAGVATADDAAALYYDPAGLVTHPALELSIGTIGAYSHLMVQNVRTRLPDGLGVQLGFRAPLPLRGAWTDRIVVGIALHLLRRNVARVIAPAPDQPFYPYYGDRMSRIVVLPGVGVRVSDRLAVGAALDVLAGLTGTLQASEGATRAIDARIDERVPTVARVILGATWQLRPSWRLGVVYHQRFELPFATTAQTMVAGEPIDLDLRASGEFTPHQVVAGVGWTRGALITSLDLAWAHWSGYPGPFVHVDSALPLVGMVPGEPPRVPFSDTVAARLGVEASIDRSLTLRGGYAFESSAVPAVQTGVTNLLDGDHHTFALGAGYAFGRFRIDAHVQLQLVTSRHITKEIGGDDRFTSIPDENNPGYPGLDSGGEVVSGGLTLEVHP